MATTVTIPLFALRRGRTSGLESAIFNLMRGFVEAGMPLRLAAAGRAALPESIARWIARADIPCQRYPGLGHSMSARFAEETLFALLSDAEHVLFPNYFLPPRGPRLGRRGVIIHDLQHKAFPAHFGPRKARWLDWQFARTLNKADLTVFISHYELEQARRHFGPIDERRIAVVPNAIDWSRFEAAGVTASIRASAGRPFILSVAQEFPHKRLPLLIEAFRQVALRDDDCRLVLVGRASARLSALARGELGESLAQRVLFPGFVSDADLAFLYAHAALFALPSAYEGFGMPAAEAMGLGCRTLVTDATALPEVTLGRAHYLPLEADARVWAEELFHLMRLERPADSGLARAIRERYHPAGVARRLEAALAGREVACP